MIIVVDKKLRAFSSTGHFLNNTEYNAQLIPAETVHISPWLKRTPISVDRLPPEIIKNRPNNEIAMPDACLSVIRSLNPNQDTITINMGIIELIKTVFVTVEYFSAWYMKILKLVTERIASSVIIFQFSRIKSF